jgi:hypothetical protein
MDALFSPGQIAQDLNEGFRGNPAIGAAVFGATVDLAGEDPWKGLFELLKNDSNNHGGASVILVGSVFGGTGASGVPTIGRIIADKLKRENIQNVRLGAVLLLPYFTFREVSGEKLQAVSQEFLPNTQIALQYYHDRRYLEVFQGVYLLGEQTPGVVSKSSVGGKEQDNEPHPVEMYAALGAVDFIKSGALAKGCMLTARSAPNVIAWQDLPGPVDLDLRLRMGQFIRFAYAYLSMCYKPVMEYVKTKNDYNTVWIRTFFPRGASVDFTGVAQNAERLRAYCERFLLWLGETHHTAQLAGIPMGIAFVDRFVDFAGDPPRASIKGHLEPDFRRLVLPDTKEGLEFKKIYEELGDARPADTNATAGFGMLVNELYRLCGERFKSAVSANN